MQGILFKFAVDIEGLYKGDENAMKAAQHDVQRRDIDSFNYVLICFVC